MLRFILAAAVLLAGCQTMTPEQQAKAEKSQAAYNLAAETLAKSQKLLDDLVGEYKALQARLDAGESLPSALVTRYAELRALVTRAAANVGEAVKAYDVAKKANDEAAAAGVAWYNRLDWWTIGKVAAGVLVGVAGVYFPVARPAAAAVQACVAGVAAVAKDDPGAGQLVKDAVLASSRALGVEAKLDGYVQKFDPPAEA